MIVSTARILASQTNGQKSRGPITPEGKNVSRANSYKHGMTGAGVVLPIEDAAEVSRRFDDLNSQFQPSTPMGKILVGRIALNSIRLERSAEQEAAYLGEKIRHAKADHDEQRQFEVETLLADLDDHPSLSVRKLLRTPEGIDALISEWTGLRDNLGGTNARYWTAAHCQRANLLTGRLMDDVPVSRINALSDALWGDFGLLEANEGGELDEKPRQAWAKAQLIALIDEEVAALRDCRAGLDLDAFEQDREDAPRRALFDTSKAAILARRYEAVNERGMFRALKELRQVEKEAAENPQPSSAYPVGPLGSFGVVSEPAEDPESGSEESSKSPLQPRTMPRSRPDRVESVEETVGPGGREEVIRR